MAQHLYQMLYARVTEIMDKYDGSHDMTHIERVLRNASIILDAEKPLRPHTYLSPELVLLGALLHDVGDKKYAQPGQDVSRMVNDLVLDCLHEQKGANLAGADIDMAERLQRIATGVSYTAEVADPDAVQALIKEIPELAIVQDADRLDSIGAVGIGRTFLYSGSHDMPLQASRELIDTRLSLLVGRMKTQTGRKLAQERTERLLQFKRWWDEENGTQQA